MWLSSLFCSWGNWDLARLSNLLRSHYQSADLSGFELRGLTPEPEAQRTWHRSHTTGNPLTPSPLGLPTAPSRSLFTLLGPGWDLISYSTGVGWVTFISPSKWASLGRESLACEGVSATPGSHCFVGLSRERKIIYGYEKGKVKVKNTTATQKTEIKQKPFCLKWHPIQSGICEDGAELLVTTHR